MLSKYIVLFSTFKPYEVTDFLQSTIDERDPDRAEILKAAIHIGFDPNSDLASNELTFLYYAILKEDLVIVGHLINYGADIDKTYNPTETIIHLCARIHNKYLLNFILSKKNLIDPLNDSGDTPLFIACYHDNIDCMDLLIKKGANVELKNGNDETAFDIILCKISNIITSKNKPLSAIYKHLDIYIRMYKLIVQAKKKITGREKHSDKPFASG